MTTIQVITVIICIVSIIAVYFIGYGTGYRDASEKSFKLLIGLLEAMNMTVEYQDDDYCDE